MRRTGFTLIEVLLVVVIVTIMVAIATPLFRNTLTTIQVDSTAQDITQLMRFLQAKAAAERVTCQLKIDVTAGQYQAGQLTGAKSTSLGQARKIPEGVNVIATKNPAFFYPDGTIDEVTVYIFRGKKGFYQDLQSAVSKEIDLGQIQTVTESKYIFTIKTQPTIGRIKVIEPS